MSYLTPKNEAIGSFTQKKSVFIGSVVPVETSEEALRFIEKIKNEHPDATHNAFAYIIRKSGEVRFSDDGEPGGTAGQPILEVLKRERLEDACAVVTRYFGGILLGAGGLVRAYSKGASLAVKAAGKARMVLFSVFFVSVPYGLYDRLLNILRSVGANVEKSTFLENVELVFSLDKSKEEMIKQALDELGSGKTPVTKICEKYSASDEFQPETTDRRSKL